MTFSTALTLLVLASIVLCASSLPTPHDQEQEVQDELVLKHVTSPLIEGRKC